MKAAQILSIPEQEPEQLFTKSGLKEERIALLKTWHPDRNPDPQASAAFAHIQKLYDVAVDRIGRGLWRTPGFIELSDPASGKRFEIRFLREHAFDLGVMYVGRWAVTFVVDAQHQDLFQHASRRIEAISFPDDKVREQIAPLLPSKTVTFKAGDKLGLVIRKTPDVLLLKDVVGHFSGRLDPRHAAWVISRLLNLASYAQVTGQVFPAIGTDSVFISPPHHSALLMGGWWFAHGVGEKLTALPAKSLAFLPAHLLKDKRALVRMTGEMIKATGREILGDSTGTSLRMNKAIPAAMVEWLLYPATDNAISDYQIWRDSVLKLSFGDRRFVKLELTANDIYQ